MLNGMLYDTYECDLDSITVLYSQMLDIFYEINERQYDNISDTIYNFADRNILLNSIIIVCFALGYMLYFIPLIGKLLEETKLVIEFIQLLSQS
jgi:hypothetical protein